MEKQMIFAILGIEETKDKEALQKAYRAKLQVTNPEDHPEEFMRLRQAYEEALQLAEKEEETEEEEDDSPVGQWMKQVKTVYGCIAKRIDPITWTSLLNDPICYDLEYSQEAEMALLHFFMGNYRLPKACYRAINEKFDFVGNAEELKESLPVGFVNFLLESMEGSDEVGFPFLGMTGEDGADFDFVMDKMEEINGLLENDLEQAGQTIAAIRATGVNHAFIDGAEALYLARTGEEADAVLLAHQALEGASVNGIEDHNTCLIAEKALFDAGEKEEAVSFFQQYVEKDPKSYNANYYLARYFFEQKDYIKAIDYCRAAQKAYNCDQLQDLWTQVDTAYLESVDEKIKNDGVATEEIGTVIRTMLRAERAEDALKYITDYPHVLEDVPYGESYRIDILSCAGRYQEAVERGQAYCPMLMDQKNEEEEEWKSAFNRTYFYVGQAYQNMARKILTEKQIPFAEKLRSIKDQLNEDTYPAQIERRGEKDWPKIGFGPDRQPFIERERKIVEFAQKANEYLEQMVEANPQDYGLRIEIINTDLIYRDYEKVMEDCKKILDIDPKYFPAYYYMELACYELSDGQGAIDAYDQALEIYKGFGPVYSLAAKTFLKYGQCQDAREVIEAGRQNVEGNFPMFDVLEYRIQVIEAGEKESFTEFQEAITTKPMDLLKVLLEGDLENNLSDLSEFFSVLADYFVRIKDWKNPYEEQMGYNYAGSNYMLYAISLDIDPSDRIYAAGYVARREEWASRAAECFRLYAEVHPDSIGALYNLANELVGMDRLTEGLSYYEKLLELSPDYGDVNGRAAFYYKRLYDRTDVHPYLNRAIELMQKAADKEESDFYDILYLVNYLKEDGQYEKAIPYVEKILGEEDVAVRAYTAYGACLRRVGRAQEAVEALKKAISLAKDASQAKEAYGELIKTYRHSFGTQRAEEFYWECFRKGIYLYQVQDQYSNLLYNRNDFEGVLRLLEEDIKREDGNRAWSKNYLLSQRMKMNLNIALRDGKPTTKIRDDYEKVLQRHPYNDAQGDTIAKNMYNALADYYAYEELNFNKALAYARKHLEIIQKENTNIAYHYYWNNDERNLVYDSENLLHGASGELIRIMRIGAMLGNPSVMEEGRSLFARMWRETYHVANEEEAFEAIAADREWGLSNLGYILEYYILLNQRDKASYWFNKMGKCPFCGHCAMDVQECDEFYEIIGLYYEYIGDRAKAIEYYQKSYKDAGPHVGFDRMKLKQMRLI